MWEISNSQQLFSFFISVLFGMAYALFYTFFKAVRKAFRHSNFSVFVEDIIFFLVISFVTFLLFLAFSNGEIRFYMLLGIFLGFCAFYFSVSRVIAYALAAVFSFISQILKRISALFKTLFGIFSKRICIIASYCGKKLRNCYKYLKKPLKERAHMVYTKENE